MKTVSKFACAAGNNDQTLARTVRNFFRREDPFKALVDKIARAAEKSMSNGHSPNEVAALNRAAAELMWLVNKDRAIKFSAAAAKATRPTGTEGVTISYLPDGVSACDVCPGSMPA